MGKTHGLRVADAVGAGITPQDIKAIWENRLADIAQDDRQLVEYVQATYQRTLTNTLFQALAARMGVKAAVEYTVCITVKIGLMITTEALWNIQGQTLDTSAGEDLLQGYLNGEYTPHPAGRTTVWST